MRLRCEAHPASRNEAQSEVNTARPMLVRLGTQRRQCGKSANRPLVGLPFGFVYRDLSAYCFGWLCNVVEGFCGTTLTALPKPKKKTHAVGNKKGFPRGFFLG